MTKENTIAELLERLNEEIKNPVDSVHKIVLKTTIDNINKLIVWNKKKNTHFMLI